MLFNPNLVGDGGIALGYLDNVNKEGTNKVTGHFVYFNPDYTTTL